MADLARALILGSKKRCNNDNNNNLGNTSCVEVINLPPMTEANFLRSQRIIEEYEKKDMELEKINKRLVQCEKIVINRPKEIKENLILINEITQKKNLNKINKDHLNRLIAENISLQNDIQGCRIETAGLLDKRQQLEGELFFKKKWYDEQQSLAVFNVAKAKATTFQGPQQQKGSMVGGRDKTRRPRRQTRRK